MRLRFRSKKEKGWCVGFGNKVAERPWETMGARCNRDFMQPLQAEITARTEEKMG